MPRKPTGKPRGRKKGTMPPNAGKGRVKGVPNKVTADVRALAQQFGPDAILGLAIMAGLAPTAQHLPNVKLAETEPVRRGCMDDVLDRAYGKATQPLEHSVNESMEGLLDRLGR